MKLLLVVVLVVLTALSACGAYDPENVIMDENLLNTQPMTAQEINSFLKANGSWLTDYMVPEYIEVPYPVGLGRCETVRVRQVNDCTDEPYWGKTVAQLIYEESLQHDINPRVILVMLQKESTAITRSVPANAITKAWPMFYGYDELMSSAYRGGSCDVEHNRQQAIAFGGVGQQIAYATWWFADRYSRYQAGAINGQWDTPIVIDGTTLICGNVATRVLYRYAPHGQADFYRIYTDWWGEPNAVALNVVPEPSGLIALVGGLSATIALLRRRKF